MNAVEIYTSLKAIGGGNNFGFRIAFLSLLRVRWLLYCHAVKYCLIAHMSCRVLIVSDLVVLSTGAFVEEDRRRLRLKSKKIVLI